MTTVDIIETMFNKTQHHHTMKKDIVHLYRKALASGISVDELEKKINQYQTRLHTAEKVETQLDEQHVTTLKKKVPAVVRFGALIIPLVFIGAGAYLVGSAVLPIVNYYISTSPQLQANNLMAPIPDDQVMDVNPIITAQASEGDTVQPGYVGPKFIDAQLDYTNLSNWFDAGTSAGLAAETQAESDVYVIDIPKLNITNAEVAIGGTDLNKSLIAYPGTALPGQLGAPVIFGHSVLRQFYNPSEKNPRRYNSIFSTIMTLKAGDSIYVTHEGVKYTYVVQDKTEVKPTDVYILAQKYDNKLLKLVTCTPEGTYLRRGVITAALVEGV